MFEDGLPSAPSTPDIIEVPAGSYARISVALTIRYSVSIAGAGARSVTVEQASQTPHRVFNVQLTASGNAPTVTISGLAIESGSADASNGYFGGDVVNRGTLTLSED